MRRSPRPLRPFRLIAALALSAGLVVAGATAAQAYDEGTIAALASQARTAQGLNPLVHNPALDAVALRWANQMAANGTLSHNPNVGGQIPGGWQAWGENIAQGYATGSAVHAAWMASPGHRANILKPAFTDIGAALIEANGTTWAVEVFAAYPAHAAPPPAPAPAPAPVVKPAPVAPAPAGPAPAVVPAPAPAPAAPAPAAPAPTPTVTPTPSPTPTPSATPTAPAPSPTLEAVAARSQAAPVWPWLAVLISALAVGAFLLPPVQRRLRRR